METWLNWDDHGNFFVYLCFNYSKKRTSRVNEVFYYEKLHLEIPQLKSIWMALFFAATITTLVITVIFLMLYNTTLLQDVLKLDMSTAIISEFATFVSLVVLLIEISLKITTAKRNLPSEI